MSILSGQVSSEEVAWAAGLFEGEGCMNNSHNGAGERGSGCQLRLGMTDRDVVEKFHQIVGCGNLYAPRMDNRTDSPKAGKKPMHNWVLYRATEIEPLLEALMPFFGERRRAKAVEVLAEVREITPLSERTHCPQGHPYSGDNLIEEPIVRRNAKGELRHYVARRCKTCRQTQGRDRMRAKKLEATV